MNPPSSEKTQTENDSKYHFIHPHSNTSAQHATASGPVQMNPVFLDISRTPIFVEGQQTCSTGFDMVSRTGQANFPNATVGTQISSQLENTSYNQTISIENTSHWQMPLQSQNMPPQFGHYATLNNAALGAMHKIPASVEGHTQLTSKQHTMKYSSPPRAVSESSSSHGKSGKKRPISSATPVTTVSTNADKVHDKSYDMMTASNLGSETVSSNDKSTQRKVSFANHNANETSDGVPLTEEQKRINRNIREQQRSSKITNQIDELRTILMQSNVSSQSNKCSVLSAAVDYIKELQTSAASLDAEHTTLLNTIEKTTDLLNSNHRETTDTIPVPIAKHRTNANVDSLDYKNIFSQCGASLAVSALDGRLITCNKEFEILSGFPEHDLAEMTLFDLLQDSDIKKIADVMGKMIIHNVDNNHNDIPSCCGVMVARQKEQEHNVQMNITLAKSPNGVPKFFNCSLCVIEISKNSEKKPRRKDSERRDAT